MITKYGKIDQAAKPWDSCQMPTEEIRYGGGGVLRGKKDRDDRRKSYKTTLKNTKP